MDTMITSHCHNATHPSSNLCQLFSFPQIFSFMWLCCFLMKEISCYQCLHLPEYFCLRPISYEELGGRMARSAPAISVHSDERFVVFVWNTFKMLGICIPDIEWNLNSLVLLNPKLKCLIKRLWILKSTWLSLLCFVPHVGSTLWCLSFLSNC